MQTQEAIQYNTDLFNETIANFENMFNVGQIDEAELEELTANAYQEYQERLENILGLEAEGYDELEYGADDSDYAEFSVGNEYGAAVLELAEAAGYEDVESFCYDFAELKGYDPNDVFGIITGEIEPSDEFSIDLADAIAPGNEELEANLFVAGVQTRGEDINDYLDDEDDEDEDEYEEDEDEEYDSEASYRVAQLESQLAEFQASGAIKDQLQVIEQDAWALVDAGKITANVVEKMLGNFSTDSDRYAAFSSVCDSNGVDAVTELYAMQKTLRVLETLPQLASFGYQVEEEISDEEFEEEVALSELASQIVKMRNQNK